MKLILALIFAIGFALVFERRRISTFLRVRRIRRWSPMEPDLLARLYAMRAALQDEQGRVDLTFADLIDGRRFAFLFSGAHGWLQVRVSGAQRRYRLTARSAAGPLWLEVSPPMPETQEPGPDDDALWDDGRSEDGWTSVADAARHGEAVALAEAFLRIWRNHLDPDAREKRLAAWRATIAAIDRAALDRIVRILARHRDDAAGDGLKAIEAQWAATAADWRLVPAGDEDRTRQAVRLVPDGLSDAGIIAAIDFKDYDPSHHGPVLLAGLPFADTVIAALSGQGDFFGQVTAFDRACQPHGYRLVHLDTQFDDYAMAVVATRDLGELDAAAAWLGLRAVVTADRLDD